MEYRELGNTGMRVGVLGFGGSEIGHEEADQKTVDALLGDALDAGLNVIDTAECYLASEEMIGRAVAARRREFHLFTKVGHESGLGGEDWDPATMERSIERSLRRLRTDVLDLVQLHSCDEATLRRGEVIEVLRRARASGRTRYIGYSGDGGAAHYAVACGEFDVLQTSVSVADQAAIATTIPLARKGGMGVIAKRPVANAAWRHGETEPEAGYHQEYWRRLRILDYPFTRDDLAAAVGTALRFTLTTPGVHTAIVGTARPGRWRENAALLADSPLPRAEYESIRVRWKEAAPAGEGGEGAWVGMT